MIVERNKDELLIKLKLDSSADKIQDLLDYLKYEELTGKSNVSKKDINSLLLEVKKGRASKSMKRLGLND